jgi:aminoglycoside 6'-N-acetyltransferase I
MKAMKIEITALGKDDAAEYRRLVRLLWPHGGESEIRELFRKSLKGIGQSSFVCRFPDRLIGFVDVSLRRDYVEGAKSSPVGFIEGVFVEPAYRRKGFARRLVRRAEAWAKTKGCAEMGSDCILRNRRSIAFHRKIGYREVNRIVCFLKRI